MSLFAKVGTEPSEAQAIIEALAPIFQIDDLKAGENVRFTLVPAPSDTGTMEPVKISIYAQGGDHLASVTRNRQGDFVATTEGTELKAPQTSTRATLYTSFYHAALQQHIPATTIHKLLRVHSYDVDFKQKVKPGDTFEVFFDGGADDEAGELLYTSMTIDGDQRSFYRFRTPDDMVDYYDEQGNSAKKFLMRNPVKGGRYTSGFGERRHPLLGIMRMHTGVDWAAPVGTPILAAGDGTVELVGGKGGYGNYVRIRHRQRLLHRLRPHVALCRRRRARRRREAGPDHRLCRLDRHVHRAALPLRGPGQQQLRQPDDHRRAARSPARGPRARRVPEGALPHRRAYADGPGHQPRRHGAVTSALPARVWRRASA